MNIRSTRWAVATAAALTLAIATPALANASTHGGVGANNLRGGARAGQSFHPTVPATKHAFPSANSTVIGSTGFIDSYEVGYFWSASRGDSVEQSFSGPATIKKATFKLDVPYNSLVGANVDWTASINGTDIGSFSVTPGLTGPVTEQFKFAKMTGGTYDVKIRVTNEVPGGDGSITLAYAQSYAHKVSLSKK